ncbi:MAG: MarR family transcriptional regulator [Mesorhizobium sp.]|uniref:MarR family winged helix-turn-helix transcriptional regulator n=1 Tax=Mesorhizobium sp. TaxID=1871066 RepID=UPI000FE8CABA|nr:MarR family winged helix-turn-helix transcriptional regulator [Mesorhizobium sp.]RWI57102.1 MAG: MarR family transcriptional regulator [Mesorhizobium sp.]
MKLYEVSEREIDEIDFNGLDELLGFLIRVAQVQVFEQYEEIREKYDVHVGAASTLIVIGANPGIRHGVLAEALKIKLAHMTKMIKSFEERGLVQRQNISTDRRIVELSLTPAGRRFVDRIRPLMIDHDRSRLRQLTNPERSQLIKLLKKFIGH